MIRALIDTDVILDVLLARQEFVAAASAIWQAQSEGLFEGYISAITPVNVFYIARKLKGAEVARSAVTELLNGWRICPLDGDVLRQAIALPLQDYEDAVQHSSAQKQSIDYVVTRNIDDYKNAVLQVVTPTAFLNLLRNETST